MPEENPIEVILKEAERVFALRGASSAINYLVEKLGEHMDPSGYDLVKKALEYYEGRIIPPRVLRELARALYEYARYTYNVFPPYILVGPLLFAMRYGDESVRKDATALLLVVLGNKYISYKVIGIKINEIVSSMGVTPVKQLLENDVEGILAYGNEDDYGAIVRAEGIEARLKIPVAKKLLLMIIADPIRYHGYIQSLVGMSSGEPYLMALLSVAAVRLSSESGEQESMEQWLLSGMEYFRNALNGKLNREELSMALRALEYLFETLSKLKHDARKDVLALIIEVGLIDPDRIARDIESMMLRFRKEDKELFRFLERNELVEGINRYHRASKKLKTGELLKILPLINYNSIRTHVGEQILANIRSPEMKIELGQHIREISSSIGDNSALVEADISIAEGNVDLGKIDEAKKYLEEVSAIELRDPQREFERVVRVSTLYLRIGEFEQAREIAERGITLVMEGKYIPHSVESYKPFLVTGIAHEMMGRVLDAAKAYIQAYTIALADMMRSPKLRAGGEAISGIREILDNFLRLRKIMGDNLPEYIIKSYNLCAGMVPYLVRSYEIVSKGLRVESVTNMLIKLTELTADADLIEITGLLYEKAAEYILEIKPEKALHYIEEARKQYETISEKEFLRPAALFWVETYRAKALRKLKLHKEALEAEAKALEILDQIKGPIVIGDPVEDYTQRAAITFRISELLLTKGNILSAGEVFAHSISILFAGSRLPESKIGAILSVALANLAAAFSRFALHDHARHVALMALDKIEHATVSAGITDDIGKGAARLGRLIAELSKKMPISARNEVLNRTLTVMRRLTSTPRLRAYVLPVIPLILLSLIEINPSDTKYLSEFLRVLDSPLLFVRDVYDFKLEGAKILGKIGKTSQAYKLAMSIITSLEKKDFPWKDRYLAETYEVLSKVFLHVDIKKAFNFAKQAYERKIELGDKKEIAKSEIWLAKLAAAMGDFMEAQKRLTMAMHLASTVDNRLFNEAAALLVRVKKGEQIL